MPLHMQLSLWSLVTHLKLGNDYATSALDNYLPITVSEMSKRVLLVQKAQTCLNKL